MRKKNRAARRGRAEPTVRGTTLTVAQYFSLSIGESGRDFPSEAARRAAWERWRDVLIVGGNLGSRPVGFWDYDGPPGLRDPDDLDLEESTRLQLARSRWLMGHGQLRVGESGQIERDIQHFERELRT